MASRHTSHLSIHDTSPYRTFDDHPYDFDALKPEFIETERMKRRTPAETRAVQKRRTISEYDAPSVGPGGAGFSGIPAMFIDDEEPRESSRHLRSKAPPPAFTRQYSRAGHILVPNMRRAQESRKPQSTLLVSQPRHTNENPDCPHVIDEPHEIPSARLTRPNSQRPWPRPGQSQEHRHYVRVMEDERRKAFEPRPRSDFVVVPLDDEEKRQKRRKEEKGRGWLKDWVDASSHSY